MKNLKKAVRFTGLSHTGQDAILLLEPGQRCPRFLEDTLLAFADSLELRRFAPLAFHRLNTPRSIAAMAHSLRKVGISSSLPDAAELRL